LSADLIPDDISSFRGLGIHISLDSIDTCFASFRNRRPFCFNKFKIKTNFARELGHDSTSKIFMRKIVNIVSAIGVSFTAEGRETDANSQELIKMGCIVAHDYLFSHAISLTQVTHLLHHQKND